MNNQGKLCTDVGWVSLNKHGEQLCGDHVEVVEQAGGDDLVVVLADGLGSGVKASILSTLTSKIISTLVAGDLSVEECVDTIAATLPVCSQRKVAYSTFTILRIVQNREAELIQFDNPHVILLRGGKRLDYPETEETIGGKRIYKSRVEVREGDIFVAASDGALNASVGPKLDLSWDRDEIARFLETMYDPNDTAKTIAAMLAGECGKLYGGYPGDDTTVCAVRLRRRAPLKLLIGPPEKKADEAEMLSAFFAGEGRRIVSGGSTSAMAARYLGRELNTSMPVYVDPEIPPTAKLDGVDLVTEGVVTMSRVLEYAKDYLGENKRYTDWSYKKDGASLVAKMLFEEATDITLFIGRAANSAHENAGLSIGFDLKMHIMEELAGDLRAMGKRVEVRKF